MAFKSGFVSIIGASNVGKSTLLNALLRQKIAITSSKPQTTRHKIKGIVNLPDIQLIFIDTPGIHDATIEYNKYLVKLAVETLQEVDVILFMIEPFPWGLKDGKKIISTYLNQIEVPCILLINKVDKIAKPQLLPIIEEFDKLYPFKAILPISAKKQAGLEDILKETTAYLPEGPRYYPEGLFTDITERQLVAEIIREKAINSTREEVPHSIATEVEEFRDIPDKNMFYIAATIYIEKASQKGIIIGKKGKMIKDIGQLSRKEIEGLLGRKVYLDLFVRVKSYWRRDPRTWVELGLK